MEYSDSLLELTKNGHRFLAVMCEHHLDIRLKNKDFLG